MVRNNGPAKAAPRWPDPRDGQEAPRREATYRQPVEPAYPGEPHFDPNAGTAGHAGMDGQGRAYGQPANRDPHPHQHGVPQQGYVHQQGYAQDGYAPDGYAQDGYAQDGYPQQGYAPQDYPHHGGHGRAEPHGGDPYAQASYGADPYAADPYAADPYAGERYAAPDPYAGQGQAATGYPGQNQAHHQGMHDPGLQDPYAQPAADAYAPQFEPYQPPTPAGQADWGLGGGSGSPHIEPAPSAQAGAYASREPRIAGDLYRPPNLPPRQQPPMPEPQLRGSTYDQHAQPSAWPAQHAESSAVPAAAHGWGTAHGYQERDYQQGRGYADSAPRHDYTQTPYAPPAEPGFGPADPDYAPAAAGALGEQSSLEADYERDEVTYEDDLPQGRGAMLKKMAAALVLAIGVGGSLAYGYKSFVGGGGSDKPPVVRTAANPAKVKPDDPGGNKFAHSDSKILGRLGDSGASKPAPAPAAAAAADPASAGDDPNGTRKVSTMVIGRDGSIVNTGSTAAAPPSAPPQGISPVPGMTIVDGFGSQRPRISPQPPPSATTMARVAPVAPSPPPAAPAAPTARPTTPPPAAVKPEVIARTEPPPAVKAPVAKPEPPIAASEASVTEEAKPAPRQRTARAPGTATAAPRASSGAGYVAVLVSIPQSGSSRMEALKQFADLQQKYAAQLGGKTPDVQSADLGAKGNYDRLIIGPPGSRQQASKLCADLKAAGHGSCWVKSY